MSLIEITSSFEQFIQSLFQSPPQPPFSFLIDFPSGDAQTQTILGSLLMTGAQIRYAKQLGDLTESEISKMREYLLSIGWDAEYHLATLCKEVLDYHCDGAHTPYIRNLKINSWQITFRTADQSLRPAGGGCGAGLTQLG